MFCYQCQETKKNYGCTAGGMCGKKVLTAERMDQLIRQLKILTLTREPDLKLGRFVAESLFMTVTNTNFDDTRLQLQLEEAKALSGDAYAPYGVLACPDDDLRSLRELLTYGVKGIAAYYLHAVRLGKEDQKICDFLFKALSATVLEVSVDAMTELVLACGRTAVDTMALLDTAHRERFGDPVCTSVRTGTGPRPGILISGHDMQDLYELLQQTDHAGVDVYTHGEMLPAHYYPALKKFQHLYGNYGSSWFRQNEDFASFNGPVILTTNCIIPVQSSYQDRIFTTGTAGYPNIPHIPDGSPKDFGAVIELAKTCPLPRQLENSLIHGGVPDLTGIAEDIRAGRIRRIIVMAGCDGRHRTRDYYTRVAEALPDDVLVVTAGCAKFRFLKLSRKNIIDAGQCNDSYRIVTMLKTLNDLTGIRVPVSFDLAWYEQKAVAVLLALLALGYRKIRLGPTLPAFLSPGVMKVLVENFALKGIGDPARDVAAMLNGC